MVEVVVASVVLMATIILVFGTIAHTRQPIILASQKLRAATYAQDVLDALRGRVSDSAWQDTNGLLTPGTHDLHSVTDVPCPSGVGGTYTITASPDSQYRKVTANVTFDGSLYANF